MSGREDVATARQKSSGGGEAERSVDPRNRRRWGKGRRIVPWGAIHDDSPRRAEAREDEQSDS